MGCRSTCFPRLISCRLSPVCVLAWLADCPPRRLRSNIYTSAPRLCSAAKSTALTTKSDEPFAIRDIQFDNPQIAVLRRAAVQIFVYFL